MRSNLVRCSDSEIALLEKAREELAKKGFGRLSNLNHICPQCGKPINGVKITYEYINCPSCGYQENNAAVSAVGVFALGAIIALGAAALMNMLAEEMEE